MIIAPKRSHHIDNINRTVTLNILYTVSYENYNICNISIDMHLCVKDDKE